MVKWKYVLLATLILSGLFFRDIRTSGAIEETRLGTLVSSMQPGTWAELTDTMGFKAGRGYILDDETGNSTTSILEFADKAVWDTAGKRFLFYGAAHGFVPNKFVQYDEASDSWSELPPPPSEAGVGNGSHSYQHNAIDPARRAYFYIQRGQRAVEKLDLNDYKTWSTLPPNNVISTGQCCIAIEWFPDIDGLIWLASGERSTGGGLAVWKRATNRWQRLAENLPVGYISGFAVYDPVHKVVFFGGGYDHDSTSWDDSKVFYKVDAAGTVTRLPDSPVPLGVMLSVTTVDPVSGHLLAFAANRNFYTFDVTANVWMRQNAQTVPLYDMPWPGNDIYDIVATPIPNYGVTMFVKYTNPNYAKIYIYKHLAGKGIVETRPPSVSAFAQKCAQAGVLGCWPFDDPSELKYGWDNTSAALNQALAGKEWHALSNTRYTTEGNTIAIENASGSLAIPVIDTTVFNSGGGSLKFTIPSQSGPQSGWFQDNFNKVLGNPSVYIAPNSPLGNVIYYQFRLRLNEVMMSNVFHEYSAVFGYTLSTPAAGSTTLQNSYDGFTADMAGKKIELTGPHAASPWVKGIYTITSFVDARTVRLDRSPTPTAAAAQAAGIVEGSTTAGGWKTVIFFGNSPKGSSSSGIEVTMMNPRQVGIPVMYGQQGYDGYGYQDVRRCSWPILDPRVTHNPALYKEPPCKRFKANQWVELTGRIEVRGASNAPQSRVQLWVDGELAVDHDKAKINWGSGDGDGLGQFDLTPYHTRKDSTQVHATGYVWYDDMILSTRPIPMMNSSPVSRPVR
jgi:hypothetical protein